MPADAQDNLQYRVRPEEVVSLGIVEKMQLAGWRFPSCLLPGSLPMTSRPASGHEGHGLYVERGEGSAHL
jgi:hypothetical protein